MKTSIFSMTNILLSTLFIALASCHSKQEPKVESWQFDKSQSKIELISTKNNSIAEVFEFKDINATIDQALNFKIEVDMNSLETLIPIRNSRIQKVLFNTDIFPTAEAYTKLNPNYLQSGVHKIKFELDAHGLSNSMEAKFRVINSKENITIITDTPLILNADQFGMTFGLEQLTKIAGLNSINTSVPLSLVLTFKKLY